MKLLLKSIHFDPEYTIGELFVDGVKECYTLEDAVREVPGRPVAEWKIPGRTAIPRGLYAIDLTFSNRFHKVLPLLRDVPGFEGVRIHTGNRSRDTEGCLLVGKDWNGGDWLDSSRLAFDALFKKLSDAHYDGEAIILEVV